MDETNLILPTSDHDALIRIEVVVNNLTTEVKNNTLEIQKVITDHESRLRVLEKDNNSYSPREIFDKLNILEKNINTSTINWKVVGILGGVLTILVGAAVPIIVALVNRK